MTGWEWWFFALMLISGTVNTLSKKIQNDSLATGMWHHIHSFNHPWFQTFVMFLGECCCLIILKSIQRHSLRTGTDEKLMTDARIEEAPLLNTETGTVPNYSSINDTGQSDALTARGPGWRVYYFLSCLDLAGTTFAGIGLVYTYASVFQMLRGSIVVFSGLFSIILLNRRLKVHNWLGIIIVTVGLFLVGYADLMGEKLDEKDHNLLVWGDICVLVGQTISAAQQVLEEKYLKKWNLHPLRVVGNEGVCGALTTGLIVLPILYFIPDQGGRPYEDSLDAMAMMGQNVVLMVMMFLYLISIAFYNYSGLSDLIIFYSSHHLFGEPWSSTGWIQLIGFFLLVAGTLLYNNVWETYVVKHYHLWSARKGAKADGSDDSDDRE